jgi:hypothetical protein
MKAAIAPLSIRSKSKGPSILGRQREYQTAKFIVGRHPTFCGGRKPDWCECVFTPRKIG